MTAGRPPKPIEQKRRTGNPGKGRLPVAGSLALVPAASAGALDELGPIGQALMDAGAAAWLAKTDQIVLLQVIEEAEEERRVLRQRWFASDFRDHDVVRRLGQVEEHLTKWLSLAGLTPTDRSRLGVAEVKAATTLEKLRASRAGRPAT